MIMWSIPPDQVDLPAGEVHVWRAQLTAHHPVVRDYSLLLSTDEATRAAKFHFEKDKILFTSAHAILRLILSRYCNKRPETFCFSQNEYGKPFLIDGTAVGDLRFNLSHTSGIVLYAFSLNREVGIDVEWIHREMPFQKLASRFFSASERTTIASIPEEMLPRCFFNCWTRKESYIKALGKGVSHPLDSFSVSIIPGEPVTISVPDDSKWSLRSIDAGGDYAAALAVEGHDFHLKFFDWPSPPL